MTPTISLAFFLLVPLAAGAGARSQSEENVLATYDLRRVMPRWDASPSWSQTLLVPPAVNPRDESIVSLDNALEYGELASFELLDLLTQVLGDELRREGRELMVEGHVLTVLAPESLHEQVRSILEGLELALSGTVPVRVDVLTLSEAGGELPPAGTLPEGEVAKQVSALLARGAQHQSFVLELSAGRTARADAFQRIPFLFDFDVEIAQSMVIFDPVMSETRDGTRIALRGLPKAGGLWLSTLFLRSDLLGEIAKKPLELRGSINHLEKGASEVVQGPADIQSPKILVRGLAFDTFLPDGQGLALTLESSLGGARTREVVFLRRLGGAMSPYVVRPIPRTSRTLIALDAELFRAPRLSSLADPRHDPATGAAQPNLVARFDGEVSGFLLEWMKARFSVWRRFGPWILIVTDPLWDRDAAAHLDRLVKSLRPATTLHDVTVELRAQGREGPSPVRMRVPVLAGSTAGFVMGRGETAVTGYSVEVAQGASVPDPYVSAVFEGLTLALCVEGKICEASGMAQLFDAAFAVIDPGYSVLGPIERPEPRVLRFDERLVLLAGRPGPVRIGSGSERPDQPGLVLEITVSPAQR